MQNKQHQYFITGTDTEVGKTFFTCAFIEALKKAGYRVNAYKPVSAGCERYQETENFIGKAYLTESDSHRILLNEDALKIIAALARPVAYQHINPFAFEPPIAPHIAAKMVGNPLSVADIQQALTGSAAQLNSTETGIAPISVTLIEGAGGWLVPLNQTETFADFVQAEQLAVILVVGLKLGCINHALLTQQSILAAGLKIAGWVANHIEPNMQQQQANIETLKDRLRAPLLAEIPYLKSADSSLTNNLAAIAAEYVNIQPLFLGDTFAPQV